MAPPPRIELEPNGLSFEFRFSDAYLESVGGERRSRGEPGASQIREPNGGAAFEATRDGDSSAKARPTRAERILSLLRRDPALTHAALAKELNLSLHSVRHHLDTLRNSGKLRRVGSRKTGRWEIVE